MQQISLARRFSNTILTVLFTIVVFSAIAIAMIQNTLFSPDFYIRQIDASGFSKIALTEIQETFRAYSSALALNIPDDFVTDHITLEQVDDAIKQTITASFKGGDPYDYSSFSDELVADLEHYVKTELGLPVDFAEPMADFAAECEQVFTRYTDSSAFSKIAYMARTYGSALKTCQIVLVAAAVILLALMLRLSPGRAGGVRNLMFAFIVMVVLNGICLFARVLPARIFLDRLGISLERESMRLLAVRCVDSAISAFIWPLMACALILIILIVIYRMMKRTSERERY